MKSAYEKAMERLGPLTELSDEQKNAIADIDTDTKAKIVEIELMNQDILKGSELTAIDDIKAEIEKLKVTAEGKKDAIRDAGK